MSRKILLIISFVLPLNLFACSPYQNDTIYISSIYDGDTFMDNKKNKYRLFGIDTPELKDKFHSFRPTKGLEYIYAKKAKHYINNLILNKYVRINKINKDKYQRFITQIFYNGKDIGIELLKKGLARIAYINVTNPKNPYYSTKFAYFEKLTNAQKYAVDNKNGIWASDDSFKKIFPQG